MGGGWHQVTECWWDGMRWCPGVFQAAIFNLLGTLMSSYGCEIWEITVR